MLNFLQNLIVSIFHHSYINVYQDLGKKSNSKFLTKIFYEFTIRYQARHSKTTFFAWNQYFFCFCVLEIIIWKEEKNPEFDKCHWKKQFQPIYFSRDSIKNSCYVMRFFNEKYQNIPCGYCSIQVFNRVTILFWGSR